MRGLTGALQVKPDGRRGEMSRKGVGGRVVIIYLLRRRDGYCRPSPYGRFTISRQRSGKSAAI